MQVSYLALLSTGGRVSRLGYLDFFVSLLTLWWVDSAKEEGETEVERRGDGRVWKNTRGNRLNSTTG